MGEETALVDRQRQLLATVFPDAMPMAQSLRDNFPEYIEITDVVARLVHDLSSGDEARLKQMMAAYVRFSDVFKQKQLTFARSGTLGSQDFEQVRREVYDDPEYMLNVYYPSLLLSYLFATNYYEILRIFRSRFLPLAQRARRSCEIGIGHGLLTGLLARDNREVTALGIDISAAAPQIATSVLAHLGVEPGRVEFAIGDAVASEQGGGAECEAGICAEVLEHVPHPGALLRAFRRRLVSGAPVFLTAAVNMESVDHLYLFRNDEEVIELVERSGFSVSENYVGLLSRRADGRDPEVARQLIRRRNPATAILIARSR